MHSSLLAPQDVPHATSGVAEVEPAAGPGVELQVTYPSPQLAAVHVIGELDAVTTPRLAALVWPRLQSTLLRLILDLQRVSFFGVAGLELVDAVRSYARYTDKALVLVNSSRSVDRALAVGGLDATVPCYPSIETAHSALLPPETPTPRESP